MIGYLSTAASPPKPFINWDPSSVSIEMNTTSEREAIANSDKLSISDVDLTSLMASSLALHDGQAGNV